jgi:hypothetical protein
VCTQPPLRASPPLCLSIHAHPLIPARAHPALQEISLLKHLNTIRMPILPDVLSDLLLMSTSRAEAERLCALQVLASACCTEVQRNRQILLDNNLFRQVSGSPT